MSYMDKDKEPIGIRLLNSIIESLMKGSDKRAKKNLFNKVKKEKEFNEDYDGAGKSPSKVKITKLVKKNIKDQEGGVGQGLPLQINKTPKKASVVKKNIKDQEGGVGQGLPLQAKKKVSDYTPKGNKAMLKKRDSDSKFIKRIAKAIETPAKKSIKNIKTINKGDTLSGIASKYGTTVKKLMELNSNTIKDPNKIYAGRKINVGEVPSTALAATSKDKPVLGGRGKGTKKKAGGKVFRRGGGKALRGMGKATYSNKMY